MAALRFAGDGEFKLLLKKVLNENLSAYDIGKSTVNWQADDMRL